MVVVLAFIGSVARFNCLYGNIRAPVGAVDTLALKSNEFF